MKIKKDLIQTIVLIWILGFIAASVVVAIDVSRDLRFKKCIQEEPTDYVCDSCYQAIYHKSIQ